MAEVRFGGSMGKLLLKGKPTEVRGFGMLDASAEEPAIGAHATKTLKSLLERSGFDVAGALADSASLRAELEASLTKDLAGQFTVRVAQLSLTAA